jgi:protease-4
VREIAKGRVWTGVQAKQLGLVDELGGFYEAVDKAKSLAGIKGEVKLKKIGGSNSPFEAWRRCWASARPLDGRTLAASAWLLGDPRSQTIMDEMAKARLRSTPSGASVLAGDTPISTSRPSAGCV